MISAIAVIFLLSPPCEPGAAVSRPGCAGADWICLSPELAAAERADREAAAAKCEAEKTAVRAEASTVLRRETGKLSADLDAEREKLRLSIDALERAERAARAADEEASSKWSTLELVGFIAGGIAVGAAAGALIAVYAR